MNPQFRRIVSRPLTDLWDSTGRDLGAVKVRDGLAEGEIKELLRIKPVRFAVADVRLEWIAPEERYRVWKQEVQPHLYDPAKPHLEDYPDEY